MAAFFDHFFFAHLAGEHDEVNGEAFGAEVGVEEVDEEDDGGG